MKRSLELLDVKRIHHQQQQQQQQQQNSSFWATVFLRRFWVICHPVFTSSDFAKMMLLQSKAVSLASNTQPGVPGLCIYVAHWQGGPVIPPGTGFPLRCLRRLGDLRWRYSIPPPHGSRQIYIASKFDSVKCVSLIWASSLCSLWMHFTLFLLYVILSFCHVIMCITSATLIFHTRVKNYIKVIVKYLWV
jgi:hypothetical protein